MGLFGSIFVVATALLLVTNRQVERINKHIDIANGIERCARELGFLSNDYLLYHESQQRARWERKFSSLSADLSKLKIDSQEEQALAENIKVNQQRLNQVFADVISALESGFQTRDQGTYIAFLQVSWSRMEVQNQGMIFDALRLAQMFRDQADRLREKRIVLLFALAGIFGIYFFSNYLLTNQRILKSISYLQAGTKIIGSGNLDHVLTVKHKDEVGELSDEFNRMTARLKKITASRTELEREIVERKRAEEALLKLNETLEQRVAERTELAEARAKQLQTLAVELIQAEERERQRFAYLLHDDLQQILASARFQLQTACRCLPPEPMLENVDRLLSDSIEKSRRLSHELSPAVLQHSGLVDSLRWVAQRTSEQFGLDVHLESDAEKQAENESMKVFLFRCAQELLFNIVKHAKAKSARVELSSSDGNLVLSVIDQGIGFNPEILNSSIAKAGFGLLTIRERARYVGGNLSIESSPGKGSRFTLTVPKSLPKADELQFPAVEKQSHMPARRAGSADLKGIRVMFTDDHKVMRQGLMSMIADQPDILVVGEADNGREALERARQVKPDVIVMDVAMPEMDGVEATRRIKDEFPKVRIIGLSMYEDELLAESMRQAGAEVFLNKSTSSAELLKAIYGKTENSN